MRPDRFDAGVGSRIVSTWTDEETTKALEAIPWKAVQAWIDERVGPTVQSQRRTLQAIFTET